MALLTLAEAKAALDITTTTYDDELPDYIAGAEAVVEFICGPVEETTQTDVIYGAGSIVLSKGPVISVTSVNGGRVGARQVGQIAFDPTSGTVRASGWNMPLLEDWYTVEYTYGWVDAPAAMKQAAKVILKHQWSSQRGPAARQPANSDSTYVSGLGYAVPNAALQMLAPYDRGPAVA